MNEEQPQKPTEKENSPVEENESSQEQADNVETPLTPEKQIEALQAELLQAKDRTMRALADAENTRKRAVKDREDAGKFAIANFARDLLDFGDNFKRALSVLPEDTPPAVSEGLSSMEKELLNVFDRHGITKIEPMDERFDPNFHEVMFETPLPGKQGGQIIQVVEPGYVIKDRLLRAAKVGIAKAAPEEPNPTDPGAKVDIQG
ncbi:MAG: nucleotide exchange factor GrpE [Pseudomonadota bacterium]